MNERVASRQGERCIHKLPDALANQIAAGEVVERPASVVKELVENAVDADARRITVEIEQGGLHRIAVTDDGIGMIPEDAEMALERHATSKLSRIEDLERLGSFGFRGEAIPSIASVAKVSLVTRARGKAEGFRILIEGGRVVERGPSGAPEGTRFDITDLFFNVPARRKFLKAPATESAHVGSVIAHAALARPGVHFRLLRDGKLARDYLRAKTRDERVRQVIDGEDLREVKGERGMYRITALLSDPARARSGATALEILVNDRPVADRALARAVAQAYGSVLPPGRYPIGVLYIDMPPERVDVNVHPQKAEVRFHDARELQGAVIRVLNEGLGRIFSVPALGLGAPHGSRLPPAPIPTQTNDFFAYASRERAPGQEALPRAHHEPLLAGPRALHEPVPAPSYARAPSDEPASLFPEKPSADLEGVLFRREVSGFYGKLRFLAQVQAMFLLCEGDDGIYVLDQHAAAERVTFHRLSVAFAKRSVASQRLLVPEIAQVGEHAVGLFVDAASDVEALGFEIRASGDRAVSIHAMPALLAGGRAKAQELVHDLFAELSRSSGRAFASRVDLVLATMACHASVRAGDALDPLEVRALLEGLDEVDFSGHCPHGRPVVTRLTFEELARRVGR